VCFIVCKTTSELEHTILTTPLFVLFVCIENTDS
jgi:hypothetical protein